MNSGSSDYISSKSAMNILDNHNLSDIDRLGRVFLTSATDKLRNYNHPSRINDIRTLLTSALYTERKRSVCVVNTNQRRLPGSQHVESRFPNFFNFESDQKHPNKKRRVLDSTCC
jgi:hypothetical protein